MCTYKLLLIMSRWLTLCAELIALDCACARGSRLVYAKKMPWGIYPVHISRVNMILIARVKIVPIAKVKIILSNCENCPIPRVKIVPIAIVILFSIARVKIVLISRAKPSLISRVFYILRLTIVHVLSVNRCKRPERAAANQATPLPDPNQPGGLH